MGESQLFNSQIPKLQSEREFNLPSKFESNSKLGLSIINEDPESCSNVNSVTQVEMKTSVCPIKNENIKSEIDNKKETACTPFTVKVEIPGQLPLEIQQVPNQSQLPSSNIQHEPYK